MIKLLEGKILYYDNREIIDIQNNDRDSVLSALLNFGEKISEDELADIIEDKRGSIASRILDNHNSSGDRENLKIKFDALTSHDITYVGIIQTARASGLGEFPLPYVLTNCHNSLCAVGGTINRDDHMFGLTAAQKYGGIYVPANQAVIHQYMREEMAGCGKMILGSDSHTRYGAIGTMAIGEGGGELVKQILKNTYDIKRPEIIGVYLQGNIKRGVGPQDVALAIIGEVFKSGFVKNKVMEFVGPGIGNLSVEFRNGIDVMTTETTCLSSIWCTDEKVKDYLKIHLRENEYEALRPEKIAVYDGMIKVELDKVEPMIALPFHPSNTYTIRQLTENLEDILAHTEKECRKQIDAQGIQFSLMDKVVGGKLKVSQAEIAGCAGGTFENICKASQIMRGRNLPNDAFTLNVYPASTPVYAKLLENGAASEIIRAGGIIKPAFCGPCFGAGDVPANNELSIRHTTRNFPNREGSKPVDGQMSSVALMDARSITATAVNGGYLTAATDIDYDDTQMHYTYDKASYHNRVYYGFSKSSKEKELQLGPNITDWPEMMSLQDNLLIKIASVIKDDVTTTDELIPSGDTSSYRSNPIKMSEFTLSKRDPAYVSTAKAIRDIEKNRQEIVDGSTKEISKELSDIIGKIMGILPERFGSVENFLKYTNIGSSIYAIKPGDGSAREQAASCQRVLGGVANISKEYATKRYRSNLINWGMLPFTADEKLVEVIQKGDYVFIEGIKEKLLKGERTFTAKLISHEDCNDIELSVGDITDKERDIIINGCLINYYGAQN
ncbi:MAG: hydratase [Thermotaleaceae bacterium]